jgi:hypothetical protein
MFEALLGKMGMSFAGSLGGSLGSGIGGGAPAGPSNATSSVYGSGLDGSGWIINFQGVQNASAAANKSGSGEALGTMAAGIPTAAWVALGVVVVAVAWKKSKSSK